MASPAASHVAPKTTHTGSQPPALTEFQVKNGYRWEQHPNDHRFWLLKKTPQVQKSA